MIQYNRFELIFLPGTKVAGAVEQFFEFNKGYARDPAARKDSLKACSDSALDTYVLAMAKNSVKDFEHWRQHGLHGSGLYTLDSGLKAQLAWPPVVFRQIAVLENFFRGDLHTLAETLFGSVDGRFAKSAGLLTDEIDGKDETATAYLWLSQEPAKNIQWKSGDRFHTYSYFDFPDHSVDDIGLMRDLIAGANVRIDLFHEIFTRSDDPYGSLNQMVSDGLPTQIFIEAQEKHLSKMRLQHYMPYSVARLAGSPYEVRKSLFGLILACNGGTTDNPNWTDAGKPFGHETDNKIIPVTFRYMQELR